MHPYLSSRARIGRGHQLLLGLIFAAAAAFLGGSGLTSAAQAASPEPNVNYHAKFLHSGKCLDNPGATMTESMPLQQYDCVSWANNERWRFEPVGRDVSNQRYYLVRNVQSGKCLNIADASLADGASVIQYTCGAQWTNEWFRLRGDTDAPDYYKLANYNSQKCINVADGSTANHARIIQYACDGYWPQGTENMQVRFFQLP
jgi:hypothetical protein